MKRLGLRIGVLHLKLVQKLFSKKKREQSSDLYNYFRNHIGFEVRTLAVFRLLNLVLYILLKIRLEFHSFVKLNVRLKGYLLQFKYIL